jgi:uncharacterized Zn finger protein
MLNLQADKMKKAIERAKAEHLKVRAISVTDRTYAVTSKQGTVYTVRFCAVNRLKLAECSCPATTYCKHMAAAAQVNIMCQSMRRGASAPVADGLTGERMEAFYHRNCGWQI